MITSFYANLVKKDTCNLLFLYQLTVNFNNFYLEKIIEIPIREHTDAITFTYDTVNGSEGSIYVSNPGVMNNSDYQIFYPNTAGIPTNGYMEIDFEDTFAFSPWLEDGDVTLSDQGS